MILLIESVSLVCVLELDLTAAGNGKTLLGTGMCFDLRHKYILLKLFVVLRSDEHHKASSLHFGWLVNNTVL